MKEYIKAAKGDIKADFVIKNGKYADVFAREFKTGDIAVYKGKIVGIGDYDADRVIDAKGGYVCPSFIDAHVHIESSMVTPAEYSRAVVPKGVTTVIADPHEIANVCGVDGIEFMVGFDTVLDIHFMMPSCVPAADFEHSGAVIGSEEIRELLKKDYAKGLGEMMNYPGVLSCSDEVIKKLEYSSFTDGHAPLLSGKDLNAYICAGIKTEHECSTGEEFNEKLSKGMYIQIREGTCSKNLSELIRYVNHDNCLRCLFCTDDRYLGDIVNEGTVNYCVKKAVQSGISPIDAVMMASTNAARCYGLDGLGAIAPNYYADIVIIDNFEDMNIKQVFKKGVLAAQDGKNICEEYKKADISKVSNTVKRMEISKDMLVKNKADEKYAIGILAHNLITKKVKAEGELSKVCVIERHKALESYAVGYVKDYGIKNGAIASTIGHDSHNIIVIGDNDEDMIRAVQMLGKQGGISVVSKESEEYLSLNIAGLMSDESYEDVLRKHTVLHKAAENMGINPEIDPFMMLAFLPLPVIPEIRITDRGIFDVQRFEFIK